MSLDQVVPTDVADLPAVLRELRTRRRLSQWALALELEISQRHLSFVELGRSKPSRALLLRWLAVLEVPLAARNQVLNLAGYAPAFDERPLLDDDLGSIRRIASELLKAYEPWPAVLLDPTWNVLAANDGFQWLLGVLGSTVQAPGPETVAGPSGEPLNLLDLALGELAPTVINLDEVAWAMSAQLRDEAVFEPALRPRLDVLESVTADLPAPLTYPSALLTRYRTASGPIALLSMFTTFGAPLSVTLSSLRIEVMLPADEATRAIRAAALVTEEGNPALRPDSG